MKLETSYSSRTLPKPFCNNYTVTSKQLDVFTGNQQGSYFYEKKMPFQQLQWKMKNTFRKRTCWKVSERLKESSIKDR